LRDELLSLGRERRRLTDELDVVRANMTASVSTVEQALALCDRHYLAIFKYVGLLMSHLADEK
jgi:hypothetical protein